MAKMMSFCGLDCAECPAYLAHKNDDQPLQERTATVWSEMYRSVIKPSDINCIGCTVATGVHFGHCGECEYRKCGQSKNLANCGECREYVCANLREFHKMVPQPRPI